MGLRKFVIVRIITAIFTLYVITTIMFFMFRFVPGDPTSMFINEMLSVEAVARQKALWGLDKPLIVQYFLYVRNLLSWDFGTSFIQGVPAWFLVRDKLVNTVTLMGPAIILMVVLGGLLGSYVGWRRGSRFEQAIVVLCLVLRSMPIFWTSLLMMMVFAFQLRWLPSGGMVTPGTPVTSLWETLFSTNFLVHLILPLSAVVLYNLNGPLMLMRSSMVEVKGEDFLDLLRAKGLTEWAIVRRAARNAILPLVTYVAILTGFLFEGQVLVETIFSWPGIGREIVDAILHHDYPVAQAAFFLLALVVVAMNFLADLLYAYLDPRIAY